MNTPQVPNIQPQPKAPPIPAQTPPPPPGGLGGSAPGGPKPPGMGMPPGMPPIGIQGHAPPPSPAAGGIVSIALPKQAFDSLRQNLHLLTQVLDMGAQKAEADIHAQSGGGMPPMGGGMPPMGGGAPGAGPAGPGQNPNIAALAAKLGLGS